MKLMRKSLIGLAAVAALLSLSVGRAAASDHIVSPDAMQSRLSEVATQRAQNVATVREVLSTPIAAEAAASVGADLDRERAGVATLSDAELSDLASRASALQSDPVAGALTSNQRLLVTIALVLVVIILVLAIV
jgi:hypothetical protein